MTAASEAVPPVTWMASPLAACWPSVVVVAAGVSVFVASVLDFEPQCEADVAMMMITMSAMMPMPIFFQGSWLLPGLNPFDPMSLSPARRPWPPRRGEA